ncbi:MAG: hypothetical protein NTY09_15260 [bacterium]|nr:hypothetical protein [bacterium]
MGKLLSFKDSYSWALYERACGRIWSGKFIFIVWGILWCAAAVYFGLWLFDFVPFKIDELVQPICTYGFLGITPIIIGWAVSRAYVFEGGADNSLKSVPLRPYQALMPRMIAVFLTWIEFALPFIIVYVLALNFGLRLSASFPMPASISSPMDDPQSSFINSFVFMGAEIAVYRLIDILSISKYAMPILYCAAFIEILGFGLLPISWGFWWGTRLKQRGGPFFFTYIAYILIPAAFYGIIRADPVLSESILGDSGWPIVLLMNPGWLVLSIIFTLLAFREWGRRSE